ncbi:hypothetical protein ElyMa_000735400 [Elysia marginata]|uniref:Uncharacterized protein n=1 Tax=Elysia marginata TaxID=1093978 RepID=A0AAV4GMN8_9GAST|nr:hypothetical protein ElyMa_000735400 [Elysia marginata]
MAVASTVTQQTTSAAMTVERAVWRPLSPQQVAARSLPGGEVSARLDTGSRPVATVTMEKGPLQLTPLPNSAVKVARDWKRLVVGIGRQVARRPRDSED